MTNTGRSLRATWGHLDANLEKLLADPTAAWARQGVLNDGTWICRFRTREFDYRVYWGYQDDETLIFLLLLRS